MLIHLLKQNRKRRRRRRSNLKIMARVKVKAGVRLLIAEERVGELYSTPFNPTNPDMSLFPPYFINSEMLIKGHKSRVI